MFHERRSVMKSLSAVSAVALLVVAGALSACNDKVPKPELESRPPATGGVESPTPLPAPGSQVPIPEPSPANPGAPGQSQ